MPVYVCVSAQLGVRTTFGLCYSFVAVAHRYSNDFVRTVWFERRIRVPTRVLVCRWVLMYERCTCRSVIGDERMIASSSRNSCLEIGWNNGRPVFGCTCLLDLQYRTKLRKILQLLELYAVGLEEYTIVKV